MFLVPAGVVALHARRGGEERARATLNLRRSAGGRKAAGVSGKFYGQATKGAWWMPWQKQAMKDVASCDKPRRAASRL